MKDFRFNVGECGAEAAGYDGVCCDRPKDHDGLHCDGYLEWRLVVKWGPPGEVLEERHDCGRSEDA